MQIHKVIAGLLDAYAFTENQLALDMVVREADHFMAYHDHVVEINGTAHWVKMLDNEFGGMAETLFKLYDITGDRQHWRYPSSSRSLPCFPARACMPDKAVGDPCIGVAAANYTSNLLKSCEVLRLGEAFIKPSFYGPLVQDEDLLGGLHANTHLAQVTHA